MFYQYSLLFDHLVLQSPLQHRHKKHKHQPFMIHAPPVFSVPRDRLWSVPTLDTNFQSVSVAPPVTAHAHSSAWVPTGGASTKNG